MNQRTVALYTLGCKLNYAESSSLGRMLSERGYIVRPFDAQADIYVINTCSVTDNADKKCRRIVRQAKRRSPKSDVVVTGCYAQLRPKEIAEIPGVSLVLGAAEKFRLPEFLDSLGASSEKISGGTGRYFTSDLRKQQSFSPAWSQGERTRSFLKVQDGCDYSCTFCTIPMARGKSRSAQIQSAVREVELLAEKGVLEVVLTGVNIGDFGKSDSEMPEEDFLQLISALDRVQGISRFRISSIEPNLLHPGIIAFVAGSDRFAPHFHMPLQSGSDKILRLMRRRYNRALYADRVHRIKQHMPHCCIGVDVITGFPGETDADFLDTFRFLSALDISYLHVFTYSERPGTIAATLPGAVDPAVRSERTTQLIGLSAKKKRAFYAQFLGTSRPVLFESGAGSAALHGFTDNYISVKAVNKPGLAHSMAMVHLVDIDPDGNVVAGEILQKKAQHVS